jgi:hypothetical protein
VNINEKRIGSRKGAKVLRDCLSLLIFFAPLRLCGNRFFLAIFEIDPLLGF